jgi:folate-binding protein YgfZ
MLEKITAKNNCVDLTDLGLIQISGKNSKQFLQGQLTCDVEEVNEQQSRLGAHCDAKGRILAVFRLFFYQDNYYFLLPSSIIPHLLSSLQKYAVFSKVSLSDVSKDWQKIGLFGSNLPAWLQEQHLTTEQNGLIAYESILNLSAPGSILRSILIAPNVKSLAFILKTFDPHSLNDWHLLDILAGIPTIYPETSGQFTPHQLNLPSIGGVSFNKGCYIGQEIIARTHYLGKSKSRLFRVSFQSNSPPIPGTPLFEKDEPSAKGAVIISAKEGIRDCQALVCLQTLAISHTITLGNLEGPSLNLLELPYSI